MVGILEKRYESFERMLRRMNFVAHEDELFGERFDHRFPDRRHRAHSVGTHPGTEAVEDQFVLNPHAPRGMRNTDKNDDRGCNLANDMIINLPRVEVIVVRKNGADHVTASHHRKVTNV